MPSLESDSPREPHAPSSHAEAAPTPASGGVRHALLLGFWLCVFASLPYALALADLPEPVADAVHRMMPYREGDPSPFARFRELAEPTGSATIGGALGVQPPPTAGEVLDDAPLPAALSLGGQEVGAAGDRGGAPNAPNAADATSLPFPVSAYEGLTREIEGDPEAMAHFYESLRAVASGPEGTKSRILIYGTSMNGADRTSSYLRHELSRYFGDGGKGFLPIARGWQSQRHKDVRWHHERWRTNVVNRGLILNGRYGLGGVLARNGATGGASEFATARSGDINREVSRFELYYLEQPEGGDVALRVDDGESTTLSTAGPALADRRHILEVPAGPHSLEVRAAGGNLRLYGVVMESDRRGVVVDGLSLVGAYSRVLQRFDPEHWATQIRLRSPDLMIFWMGGNDAAVRAPLDVPAFRAEYAESLRRARAGRPEASCLVMSVLDKGQLVRGRIQSLPRMAALVEAQEGAALDAGCAFFNAFEATGGEGTIARWRAARPTLVIADLGHLTDSGSLVVGSLLTKALLAGYAAHVRAR